MNRDFKHNKLSCKQSGTDSIYKLLLINKKNLKIIMVRDGMCGGSIDALKKCCSHFKLALCYFWSITSPYAKFDPNWTKNTKVRNFHFWSILVGRAGRSKNGCMHIKLILCCCCPIISPHTKFHPNRTKKHRSLKFSLLVDFGWFC